MYIVQEVETEFGTAEVQLIVCDWCGTQRGQGKQEWGWLELRQYDTIKWTTPVHFCKNEHAQSYLEATKDATPELATPQSPYRQGR